MLNDAKMRNNGDGTVTFEFQMDATDMTEIAVLKKMMSDYECCISILRKSFKEDLYECELCGRKIPTKLTFHRAPDGSLKGPYRYCKECSDKIDEIGSKAAIE